MNIKLLPALVTLSLGVMNTSCDKNTTEPVAETAGPLTVALKVGQAQTAGPLSVKVVSVEDRRCAREECSRCYGGYAKVQVDVKVQDQEPQRLTFNRVSCLGPDDLTLSSADSLRANIQLVAGYRIGLVNMTDFVRANNLPTNEYTVTFLLVKK